MFTIYKTELCSNIRCRINWNYNLEIIYMLAIIATFGFNK